MTSADLFLATYFVGAFCYVEIEHDGWDKGLLNVFITCLIGLFCWYLMRI